jgi:hypothetical protein
VELEGRLDERRLSGAYLFRDESAGGLAIGRVGYVRGDGISRGDIGIFRRGHTGDSPAGTPMACRLACFGIGASGGPATGVWRSLAERHAELKNWGIDFYRNDSDCIAL